MLPSCSDQPYTEVAQLREQLCALQHTVSAQRARIAALEAEADAAFRLSCVPKWIYDPATLHLLDVNDAALRLYGYDRDSFLRLTLLDIRPPEEREALLAHVQQLGGHQSLSGPWRHLRRDGSALILNVASREVVRDGRVARLVILTDLTERTHALAELKESKEWLQRALEYAQAGVFDCELATGWTRWSATVGPILGFAGTTQGIFMRDYERMVHPEDRALCAEARRERMANESCAPVEYRLTGPDGRERWIFQRSSCIRSDDGRPLRDVGIVQDITERKSTELALRQSEACFRLLAEGTRNVVWISDPAVTRLLYLSPSFSNVWGLDPEDLRAMPGLWQTLVHRDDRQILQQTLLRQIAGEEVEAEFRIIRPDGQLRWLSIRSLGTTTNRGERIVCGITEDITQRKLADLRKVEDALHQRDTLVREVHHRIKNNLQGVAGLLRSHAQNAPHALGVLETAISQVQAIATVHGLQGLRVGRADLSETVHTITGMLESLTKVSVRLDTSASACGRWTLAEEESVACALIINEVIFNAIKHATSNDAIRVGLNYHADCARIEVVNPGRLPPGFDMDARVGIGTGLALVCALLPAEGLKLDIRQIAAGVRSVLTLRAPIVQLPLACESETIS